MRTIEQNNLSRFSTIEPLESRQLMSAVAPGGTGNYDVVMAWSRITSAQLRTHMGDADTAMAARNAALVQVAVHDAMNGVLHQYAPIEVDKSARRGTDPEAAAAGAAFRVLTKIFPKDKATLVKNLNVSLGNVDDKKAAKRGVAFGKKVADAVLKKHRQDGYEKRSKGFVEGSNPGQWRATSQADRDESAKGRYFLNAPFLGPQLPLEASPEVTSAEYTAAYNEVKALGSSTGSARTADQTQIARFWSYDRGSLGTVTTLLNQTLRTIATTTANSPIENAELFAKANIAMADAADGVNGDPLTGSWRPETGIRLGDADGNPATTGDATWQPLGAAGKLGESTFTPSGPSQRCYQAAMGGAMFEVLRNAYGKDKLTFELKSDELPKVTRQYTSFSQAEIECADSRVYLGVNWRFDVTHAAKIGHAAGAAASAQFASTGVIG